jgi:hypothetical protein
VPGAFRYSNRSTCRAAKSSTAPLVRLRPLQGTTRQGPPVHPSARLSSGRLALRAPPKEASSCPPPATPAQPRRDRSDPPRENPRSLGFPAALVEFYAPTTLELRRVHFTPVFSPGTFRPQGVSPSRRLAPRLNARPCFMPVTPMGLCSPGISPHSQVSAALAARLPSRRFSSHPQADHCSDVRRLVPLGLSAHVQTIRRPQGLAPAVNPYRREGVLHPRPDGRFPPELCCLSRVLPKPDGRATRDAFTPALCRFDRP